MDNREAQAVTFKQSGHVAIEHTECDNLSCQFCVGGLFGCTNCMSFEGATTTHCPGSKMTPDEHDAVYQGKLDYRNGEWVSQGSPHTPNRRWELYWNPTKESHKHYDNLGPLGTIDCDSEFCLVDNDRISRRNQFDDKVK